MTEAPTPSNQQGPDSPPSDPQPTAPRTVTLEDLKQLAADLPLNDEGDEEAAARAGANLRRALASLGEVMRPSALVGIDVGAQRVKVYNAFRFPTPPNLVVTDNLSPDLKGLEAAIGRRALGGINFDAISKGAYAALTAQVDNAATSALAGVTLPEIDFGIDQYLKSFPTFNTDYFRRLYERFQPRNLRDADVPIAKVEEIMREEGIPFCLVPDPETAELLTASATNADRRRILTDRADVIFTTCESVIALCIDQDLPTHGHLIRAAIRTYTDGHHEAAQALATVVLDQLIARHKNHNNIKSAATGHGFIKDHMGNREAFFLRPLPFAHTKTHEIADWSMYNRHATVHQPGSIQLTPSNAVHAIMLASSLLGLYQNLW